MPTLGGARYMDNFSVEKGPKRSRRRVDWQALPLLCGIHASKRLPRCPYGLTPSLHDKDAELDQVRAQTGIGAPKFASPTFWCHW